MHFEVCRILIFSTPRAGNITRLEVLQINPDIIRRLGPDEFLKRQADAGQALARPVDDIPLPHDGEWFDIQYDQAAILQLPFDGVQGHNT